MAIRTDIFNQLSANTDLTAVIADRIYYVIATTGIYPCVVIEVSHIFDSKNIVASPGQQYRVTITAVAENLTDADSVAAIILTAVNRQTFGNVRSIAATEQTESATSDNGLVDRIFYAQTIMFDALYTG